VRLVHRRLQDHREDTVAKRAFISFQMEDAFKRNHLRNQAQDERNDLEFIDYSVKEPWDNAWKTECKKRIAMTSGTIVIIGDTTHQSEAVKWEIQESDRQGHPVFGIWGRPGLRPALPIGLSHSRVIEWKIEKIIEQIDNW
jgi:antiphage defense system Thoeris ThsB-like protein